MPTELHNRSEQVIEAITAGLDEIIPHILHYLDEYGHDQLAERLSSNTILCCMYWIGIKSAHDYGITNEDLDSVEEVLIGVFRGVFADQWIENLNRMMTVFNTDEQAISEGKEFALSGTFYRALLQ